MQVPTIEQDGRGDSSQQAATQTERSADLDVEGPAISFRTADGTEVRLGPEALQIWVAILQTAVLLYVVMTEAQA